MGFSFKKMVEESLKLVQNRVHNWVQTSFLHKQFLDSCHAFFNLAFTKLFIRQQFVL